MGSGGSRGVRGGPEGLRGPGRPWTPQPRGPEGSWTPLRGPGGVQGGSSLVWGPRGPAWTPLKCPLCLNCWISSDNFRISRLGLNIVPPPLLHQSRKETFNASAAASIRATGGPPLVPDSLLTSTFPKAAALLRPPAAPGHHRRSPSRRAGASLYSAVHQTKTLRRQARSAARTTPTAACAAVQTQEQDVRSTHGFC